MIKLIARLQNALSQGTQDNRFLKNLAWLGMSEMFVRVTRLITAIVLARLMDPLTFGVAALVLTINELIRVFNRNGIGAKIVQCSEEDLLDITNTAYRLNFIFCITLFFLQCLLAYPLAAFYETPELVPMLQVLSVTYLLMPFGMVQAALVQRQQGLKITAFIDGMQVGIDNIITTILAVVGLGAWAIVLPKFLTSPIWVFGYRHALKWQPKKGVWHFNLWQDVLKFGRYYLSIEVLKTARLNLDNMIVARLLGLEALGLYYFARNAGLGFSLTLNNAISSALYPNLCEVQNNVTQLRQRFVKNLTLIVLIAVPLISLQAGLAFIYVPIVFGEQWLNAIPILTLLCLSALPRPLADSASTLLLATGRISTDYKWNIVFTFLFIITVSVAAHFSLFAVAASVLAVYAITHPIYLYFVWHKIFKIRSNESSTNKEQYTLC